MKKSKIQPQNTPFYLSSVKSLCVELPERIRSFAGRKNRSFQQDIAKKKSTVYDPSFTSIVFTCQFAYLTHVYSSRKSILLSVCGLSQFDSYLYNFFPLLFPSFFFITSHPSIGPSMIIIIKSLLNKILCHTFHYYLAK